MKACRDCKYWIYERGEYCTKMSSISVLSGKPIHTVFCESVRSISRECKPEALLFEPKEKSTRAKLWEKIQKFILTR